MKLIIPKKLKVGSKTYTVELVPAWDTAKGHENFGKTSYGTQQIHIDKQVHQEQIEDTFLHEMLHCVLSEAGFGDTVDLDQETLVRRMTPVLYQVIKENKLFT